ncbi:MAG: hypothetical protein ACK4IA_16615 [Paracoccus hibiscisoli]|uniref:hypothetical protein n=1 Tax=Paracoccus hibiscisoli TaxID=2023261 RepID=UPI0039194300
MSIHFASMTVSQIVDRAHKLMEEGNALARLAGALAEFEETTGRKLFLSDADQGTQYVGTPGPDLRLTFPEVAAKLDTPADPVVEAAPTPEPVKKASPANAEAAAAKPARDQEPVKKPAARPFAAPATAKPQTTDRPWGALSLPERAIVKHLEKMAPGFTPAEDLTIAELLIGGNKIEAVALQLEVQASMALARWKAFLCAEVLGENGKPSMDGQQRLLAALRYRKDHANA